MQETDDESRKGHGKSAELCPNEETEGAAQISVDHTRQVSHSLSVASCRVSACICNCMPRLPVVVSCCPVVVSCCPAEPRHVMWRFIVFSGALWCFASSRYSFVHEFFFCVRLGWWPCQSCSGWCSFLCEWCSLFILDENSFGLLCRFSNLV